VSCLIENASEASIIQGAFEHAFGCGRFAWADARALCFRSYSCANIWMSDVVRFSLL